MSSNQFDILLNKMNSLTRAYKRDRRERTEVDEKEAKTLLIGHLESLKHTIDDELEEPGSPRDLDRDDRKDKKTMAMMIQLVDSFIGSMNGEVSDDEEESDEQDEEEEEEIEEESEHSDVAMNHRKVGKEKSPALIYPWLT